MGYFSPPEDKCSPDMVRARMVEVVNMFLVRAHTLCTGVGSKKVLLSTPVHSFFSFGHLPWKPIDASNPRIAE